MTNKIEYFWETEYKFGEFLKRIFGDNVYKRKFSLTRNGIYNLLYIDNKIYEVKYGQSTKGIIETDNHNISDINKKFIIDTICKNLKTETSISGGKIITFPVQEWIAKVEVIKKLKEPS